MSLLAMIIVLMGISVSAAAPWTGYLTPQDSTGNYGQDIGVELGVTYDDTGLPYGALAYQVDIHFDPECVNITGADFSESPFGAHMFTPYEAGVVRILEDNYTAMTPISAGTHKMAVLTLNGNYTDACDCDIWFDVEWCVVSDSDGGAIANTYTNGTYTCTPKTNEVPTADSLSISEDIRAPSGTYVEVPVHVENVRDAPVQGIRLRVDYAESVLNLTEVTNGILTSIWTNQELGEDGHSIVVATGEPSDAIQTSASGSVVLLNFSVIGTLGDTSPLDLSGIELSNPEGLIGTTSGINGSFLISSSMGSIEGTLTHACNGSAIAGVVVALVVDTTITDASGNYNFTDVSPGDYTVSATKPKFWDNSTNVTVVVDDTVIADIALWLKGDLNDNCVVADAGDVVLMLQAAVGNIPGNVRYDLNENGIIADAGDVVLMLRAAVKSIILW